MHDVSFGGGGCKNEQMLHHLPFSSLYAAIVSHTIVVAHLCGVFRDVDVARPVETVAREHQYAVHRLVLTFHIQQKFFSKGCLVLDVEIDFHVSLGFYNCKIKKIII